MLPKYSKVPDIESGETVPFIRDQEPSQSTSNQNQNIGRSTSNSDSNSTHTVPTYPPGPVDIFKPNADGTHNVTYTFVPKWPVEGKKRHAMGVLGKTKAETIQIVQRGFPQLAFYEPERILFSIPLHPNASDPIHSNNPDGGWATVMDEAWAQFATQPPTRLRVEVEDAPGDYSKPSVGVPIFIIFLLALIFG